MAGMVYLENALKRLLGGLRIYKPDSKGKYNAKRFHSFSCLNFISVLGKKADVERTVVDSAVPDPIYSVALSWQEFW